MFKFIIPNNGGLWHLEEQCGIDLYMDLNADEYLKVNMLEYPEYKYAMFEGKTMDFAKNWLANQIKR